MGRKHIFVIVTGVSEEGSPPTRLCTSWVKFHLFSPPLHGIDWNPGATLEVIFWTLGWFLLLFYGAEASQRGASRYHSSGGSWRRLSGLQDSPGVSLESAHPCDPLTEPDHMSTNLESKFQKGLMSLAPGVLGWGHVGKKVFLLVWHGPEPNKQKSELIGRQRHSTNEIPMAMATHCWLSDYAEAWPASYSLWFKELRLMPDLLTVDSSILRRVLGIDIFRTLWRSIYTLFWEFWSEEKWKVKESKRVQVWMVAVVVLNSCQESFSTPIVSSPAFTIVSCYPPEGVRLFFQESSGIVEPTGLHCPGKHLCRSCLCLGSPVFKKKPVLVWSHSHCANRLTGSSSPADKRQSRLAEGMRVESINSTYNSCNTKHSRQRCVGQNADSWCSCGRDCESAL